MAKKVLILPGDGTGPAVIGAAKQVLQEATGGLELLDGEIGESAFRRTGRALPAETVSLLAEADAAISGHTDTSRLGMRNPLEDVRRQMNLFQEVRPLQHICSYLGSQKTNCLLITESPDSLPPVREYSTLYGITKECDLSSEAAGELFSAACSTALSFGRSKACLVRGNGGEPESDRLLTQAFEKAFKDSGMETDIMSEEKVACRLALDPSEFDVLVSGPDPAGFLRGMLSGMIGGSGLTPVAFIGKDFGLFMPSRGFGEVSPYRPENPTAAILAAAMALRHLGLAKEALRVENAVYAMYEEHKITRDLGGKTEPGPFVQGVIAHMHDGE
ncbi:MAG: isocitrate/isopropylmalate family dehydrogenase [Methanomethylophilus sp.]|jgi:isocitrate/isopropylmalate dehydrogenase